MGRDLGRAEHAVLDFLEALGFDPKNDSELRDTPSRVVAAFANELLRGYDVDLEALFSEAAMAAVERLPTARAPADSTDPTTESSAEPARSHQWVLLRELNLATVCPHHLLPALGVATVGYVAGEQLFGLGTLASLVDALSRRLALQEAIGQGVVDALMQHGGAQAAYCEITLTHSCLSARTPGRELAKVTTIATSASFSAELMACLTLALSRSSAHGV